MASLSKKLYDELAKSEGSETLPHHKRSCFISIWYWLYLNQPEKVLRKELDAVATTIDSAALPPNYVLELAWKAEALERLLKS